jgi:acyl-CoA hydrolase
MPPPSSAQSLLRRGEPAHAAHLGENQLHVSQVVGWCEADSPMVELPARPSSDLDRRIATFIAERIPDGSTLQAGIGAVPNAVLELLRDHRERCSGPMH